MTTAPEPLLFGEGVHPTKRPPDLLEDASNRLRFVGHLVVLINVINLAINFIVGLDPQWGEWVVGDYVLGIVVSLGLAVYAGNRKMNNRQMVVVGLLYLMILTAFDSLLEHSRGATTDGLSTTAVGIMLFPVFIPCSPRLAAVAGALITLLDASVFVVLTQLIPAEPVRPTFKWVLDLFQGDIVAVVLAWGLAHVVRNLEDKITQARHMGAYQLEKKLGEGGMGEVWRATHARLSRPAALKLIRADKLEHASDIERQNAIERFTREAKATAMLRSPHTIDILDFGATEDGTVYYAMELLDGVDLHDAVYDFGAFGVARTCHVLHQVCLSLAEAHAVGLIHRDIKPSNIYIVRGPPEPDLAKVLDFGLVKLREGHDNVMSEAGQLRGTAAFMAPEQGRGDDIDGTADVYALGCVGYWLLTGGDLVFGTNTAASAQLVAHATQTPRLVSRRVSKPIPPELDKLLFRCLAKQPVDRPTAQDMADELEPIMRENPWHRDDAEAAWKRYEARRAAKQEKTETA